MSTEPENDFPRRARKDGQSDGERLDFCPTDDCDPVIEAYKKGVDRTLLRENLKLSPQERSEKFASFMRSVYELRRAAAQGGKG